MKTIKYKIFYPLICLYIDLKQKQKRGDFANELRIKRGFTYIANVMRSCISEETLMITYRWGLCYLLSWKEQYPQMINECLKIMEFHYLEIGKKVFEKEFEDVNI